MEHLSTESTADGPRAQRLQVRLTREPRLDRLQPACCLQEEGRGLARSPQVQGDLSPQALRERGLPLVERPVGCCGEQCHRGLRGSGQVLGLGGLERAPSARRGIRRQRGGAFEERCRRSETAASLRASGRMLQLGGDFLVWRGRGPGAMPDPPIRVSYGVGCLREREVDAVTVVGGS